MELNLAAQSTTNSTTSLEPSFEICKEAKDAGLILRHDTIRYRDQEVHFLSDISGLRCFAQWRGELIDLGINNIFYKEDICRFIDRRFDLITTFRDLPNFVGAKLEYFRNGDYRDIRLSYKGRILKVFLVAGEVNETYLISESKKILINSGLLEEY